MTAGQPTPMFVSLTSSFSGTVIMEPADGEIHNERSAVFVPLTIENEVVG